MSSSTSASTLQSAPQILLTAGPAFGPSLELAAKRTTAALFEHLESRIDHLIQLVQFHRTQLAELRGNLSAKLQQQQQRQ